jgi:hypothetical protein
MSAAASTGLRPVIRIEVDVAPSQMLGKLNGAERRLIPILGGRISGPDFSGTLLPGGSDIQLVREDGVVELTARYAADLGALGTVLIENQGVRRPARNAAGEAVPDAMYFRGTVRFAAPAGPLQWLNDSVFVNSGHRDGNTVYLDVFEVI